MGRLSKYRIKKRLGYSLYLLISVIFLLELLGPWLAENLVDQRFSKSGIQEGLQVKAFEEESGGAKKAINTSNKHLLHPYLGFSQNPNANFQAKGLGLFGPLPNNEKNENQFNIYITGGSVAKQTFASNRILKEELKSIHFLMERKYKYCAWPWEATNNPNNY
jgi:hypothetical protein